MPQAESVQIMSPGPTLSPAQMQSPMGNGDVDRSRRLPIHGRHSLSHENALNHVPASTSTPITRKQASLDLPTWTPLVNTTELSDDDDHEDDKDEMDILPAASPVESPSRRKSMKARGKPPGRGQDWVGAGTNARSSLPGPTSSNATANAPSALVATLNAIARAANVDARPKHPPPPPPPARSTLRPEVVLPPPQSKKGANGFPTPFISTASVPGVLEAFAHTSTLSSSAPPRPSQAASVASSSTSTPNGRPSLKTYADRRVTAKSRTFAGVVLSPPSRQNAAKTPATSGTVTPTEQHQDVAAAKRKRADSLDHVPKEKSKRTKSFPEPSSSSNLANLFSNLKSSSKSAPRAPQKGVFFTSNERISRVDSPDPLSIAPSDPPQVVQAGPSSASPQARVPTSRAAASTVDEEIVIIPPDPRPRVTKTYKRPKDPFFETGLLTYFEPRGAPKSSRLSISRPQAIQNASSASSEAVSTDRTELDDLVPSEPPSRRPRSPIQRAAGPPSITRNTLASALTAAFAKNNITTSVTEAAPRPVRTLSRRIAATREFDVVVHADEMDRLLDTQTLPLALDLGLPKWPKRMEGAAGVAEDATQDEEKVSWWDRDAYQWRLGADTRRRLKVILGENADGTEEPVKPRRTAGRHERPVTTKQVTGSQMWIDRLERNFGPGKVDRGVGRKPKRVSTHGFLWNVLSSHLLDSLKQNPPGCKHLALHPRRILPLAMLETSQQLHGPLFFSSSSRARRSATRGT
ncbi:hypothetical protein FA95DRAFT_439155 [Auriscalpium vulgare]|uniref:Uncharacterized protein n=1 Tax=Auriscalpium vulgare TaxID=40419 RepID=A0ACB8RHH2_9AGAM|nr:hypothetical protein FA95DRAFT_439155 [Auriscalpium vulgare]